MINKYNKYISLLCVFRIQTKEKVFFFSKKYHEFPSQNEGKYNKNNSNF